LSFTSFGSSGVGSFQYFSSPTQTPKTKSKLYWLLALVLVMELYDFVYMITFPAILGVMTLAMLVAILTVRIRKQTMPKLFQVLGAAIFLAWVGSHILVSLGSNWWKFGRVYLLGVCPMGRFCRRNVGRTMVGSSSLQEAQRVSLK